MDTLLCFLNVMILYFVISFGMAMITSLLVLWILERFFSIRN
jgi:hypothetical protein